MPRRSIRIRSSLAAAFLAVFAMLLSLVHVQSGHNVYAMAQAEAQRHAELAATIAEHGHSHDEGDPDERIPGHVHGHNTSDHVHETANLVAQPRLAMPRFVEIVARHEPQGGELGIRHGEGVLTAEGDGAHGWFWRNRGSKDVTITLKTNGAYAEIKRMI